MSDDILTAATDLTDALLLENAALSALDFVAASRVVDRKQAATAALADAQRRAATARPDRERLRTVAARLQTAVEDNRRLLEHAMRVQQRVIGILAQAARSADPAPRYGRSGAYAARPNASWAISASA